MRLKKKEVVDKQPVGKPSMNTVVVISDNNKREFKSVETLKNLKNSFIDGIFSKDAVNIGRIGVIAGIVTSSLCDVSKSIDDGNIKDFYKMSMSERAVTILRETAKNSFTVKSVACGIVCGALHMGFAGVYNMASCNDN